jgi:hypothetical protein
MSEEKVRISVIDFMPLFGKVEAGKDKNGTPVYYGDTVSYNNENFLIAYRYGDPMLKQIGMMAMIGSPKYKEGDFYNTVRQNIMTAGMDWLIIGYENDPFIEKVQALMQSTN